VFSTLGIGLQVLGGERMALEYHGFYHCGGIVD